MSIRVEVNNRKLQYMGRIGMSSDHAPVFLYPYTSVTFRFRGTTVCAYVKNKHDYWDNYMGIVVDGVQSKVKLELDEDKLQRIVLAEHLADTEHEVTFFKRQDSCHMVTFYGLELEDDSELLDPPKLPQRRIEVYGDSVSAGEVSEAVEYVGQPDPEWHQGEFSNSYYSYAAIAARKLNAQLYDIAQGGIALMDRTGWFKEPDAVGMESAWDKLQYNPDFGASRPWDFSNYRPHVVIVAIGQNDNHPIDYMKEDYDCEQSKNWRSHYKQFIQKLRETYPTAPIILTTTILCHDPNWDRSIEQVCQELGDDSIYHFLYEKNGVGTPGHIRIPEAEQMAEELAAFITSLGDGIWEDK